MLKSYSNFLVMALVALSVPEFARAAGPTLAFPTAEGYGRFAKGGRGGRVIHVTNLNDAGPGSLRAAVEAEGPRTVVFDISGLITLESRLIIRKTNSELTIAGQTAPGKGICLRKYNMGMLGATNVIIRYVRVRPGNLSGMTLDGMGMASSDHCIIDHCSISWTLDEAFSSRGGRNITLQRTLISEALNEAGHKKYPPGTQHGYAASIGGDIGSFHHNLLAHCAGRNWSLAGGLSKPNNEYAGRLDLRNNVIYNWKSRATDGGAHEVNFVNNYYQPGPATKFFYALNAQYGGFPGSQRYYFAGNLMVGHFGLTNQTAGRTATTERGGRVPTEYSPWSDTPFFESHVKTHSAQESYDNVLANVGCNFPALDDHDTRVIAESRSGTAKFKGSKTGLPGLPDSQDDVGGWENYPEIKRPADWDTDLDGMPDDWEKRAGLDPKAGADGNADRNGDGYTNLEEYLGSLVGEFPARDDPDPGPLGVDSRLKPTDQHPVLTTGNRHAELSCLHADWRYAIGWRATMGSLGLAACFVFVAAQLFADDFAVLQPDALRRHVTRFNAMETEAVTNHVSNMQSGRWLEQNIPRFECPDPEVEETYYFRWWSFRKHIKQTPHGFVITEFLTPVKHAGAYNTISCAAGLHLAEGRWLRDDKYLNDYTRFWLQGNAGKPQPHFHRFSSWFAAAAWDRYLVSGDQKFLVKFLPDLVADYRVWESERQSTNGLFWQYDVADAMEESISGSRKNRNLRPTINSYMFANARAIANIAALANKPKIAAEFSGKADTLLRLTQDHLWDTDANFFKVLVSSTNSPVASAPYVLSTAREAIGFIPWMFSLPEANRGFESAWLQFTDPHGFRAPFGITTAERRHPEFRSHGIGTCEWDGAVWPFATSQTLYALANVLRDYPQDDVTAKDYFDAFLTYTRSQRANGQPYIGEYLDEVTGDWINRTNRSSHYNHSTYADLLITGVIGLQPGADETVKIHPLLPPDTWDWFCLDGIRYHGHMLTVIWDQDGTRYGRGAGLQVLTNGKLIAQSTRLQRITGKLP